MFSDQGGDGVAFKRLGIRGSLAPERPVLHRSSRARAAVSKAFQDAENCNWRCSRPSGVQRPPPQDSTRTCHRLPPLRDLPIPQSNQQRATLTRKGAVDKTQNYGHLTTYSARVPKPICRHSHRRMAQLRDESAKIGDGGQNAVDLHSVKASLTTWQTSGKFLPEPADRVCPVPSKGREAERLCPAPGGALGPRLVHMPSEPSGSQRSLAVSSGRSFTQVTAAILPKPARGQNPDEDEVGGSSPPRPTTCDNWRQC